MIKPQYVDHIPKAVKGKVGDILAQRDERKLMDHMVKELGSCLTPCLHSRLCP